MDSISKELLYALTRLVEHDEYLIEQNVLRPFVELEQARKLINSMPPWREGEK